MGDRLVVREIDVEFAVDEKTGKISPTGRGLKIGAPVDVKFVEIK